MRKSFGKTEIIRGANLAVQPGERVAIIGPNGAGKSHAVQPDQRPLPASSAGEILLNGAEHQRPEALRDQPQRAWRAASRSPTSFTRLSVFENIRCAVLWSLGYRTRSGSFLADLHDANERAEEVLEMIGLDARRDVLAMT